MQCPNCHAEISESSLMCNNCGKVFNLNERINSNESHEKTSQNSDSTSKLTKREQEFLNKFKKKKEPVESSDKVVSPSNEIPKEPIKPTQNMFFNTESSQRKGVDLAEALKQQGDEPADYEPVSLKPIDKGVSLGTRANNPLFANNNVSARSFNIENLRQKPDAEEQSSTPKTSQFIQEIPEEEQPTPEPKVNPLYGKIILGVLGLITIIVAIIFLMKINELSLITKGELALESLLGKKYPNKFFIILIYFALIFFLSYDSYKSKQSSFSKEAPKAVTVSLILAIASVFLIDGISNIQNSVTYLNALIRFIFLTLILFANVYFRNIYSNFVKKFGIDNILFELFIYFNLFTIIILLFN